MSVVICSFTVPFKDDIGGEAIDGVEVTVAVLIDEVPGFIKTVRAGEEIESVMGVKEKLLSEAIQYSNQLGYVPVVEEL